MNILITGGCGVMGSVLTRRFAEEGHHVRVLTLANDPNADRVKHPHVEVRYGDVSDAGSIENICDGIDTVYHLAAIIIAYDDALYTKVNVGGTRAVLNEAKKSGVRHFVHVSSASVVYPTPTAYSQSKKECEELVITSGLPYTIIRPTLVYDVAKGGQEFDIFLDYIRQFPILPFIGNGRALKRPVFVNDIIFGLVKLLDNPVALGKIYNFAGSESISISDFARLCCKLLGFSHKPIVYFPIWFCRALSAVLACVMKHHPLRWPVIAGMIYDADLDPASAIEDLGFAPRGITDQLPKCFPRSIS